MNMRKQRVIGLVLVGISWALLVIAATGATPEEQDATAVLLTLPLGLYMMFTDDYVLYDGATGTDEEQDDQGIDFRLAESGVGSSGPIYRHHHPHKTKGAATWQERE